MQRKNNLKKYLKMLGGISLAFAVLTVSVFAAAPTATIDGNTISVSYEDTEAGHGAFIYVFNTGLTKGDAINQELIDNHLVWAGIATGGVADIELPEGTGYGAFTVVIGAKGMPADKAERSVTVLSLEPGIEEAAAEAIAGATSADAMAEMLAEYNNKAYVLDLSALDGQKEFIFDAVEDLDDATVEDIVSIVESAAKISEIVEATEATAAKILKESKLALGLTDDIEKYSGTVAKNVVARLKADMEIDEIKTIAQEELALAALNGATASNVIETIEEYNDIFNVTFSSKLEDVNEYDVEKELAKIEFDDVDEVEDIVNDVIDDVYEDEKNGNKKTSGGGGGGGGRGGYAATSTLEQPEVKEINGDEDLASGITDIEGYDWAKEAIEYLYANSIMTGDGNGMFRPGDSLTREEFVKLVIAAIGGNKTEEATTTFTDVPEDAWFKPYVETAFAKGIVTGVSAEEFGVGQYITRQDAAVMLNRAAEAYYTSFAKKTTLVEFSDFDDVAEYAKVSVDMLARAKIINGYEDGTFKPNNTITRAEIAKVIYACIGQ